VQGVLLVQYLFIKLLVLPLVRSSVPKSLHYFPTVHAHSKYFVALCFVCAANGMSLKDVADIAKLAASRCGSLGIALNSVTVPGADVTNDRLLDDNTIEIGLGIHGEAGMKQSPMLSANEMAQEMISTIQNHGRIVLDKDGSSTIVPMFMEGDDICLLVNNLGGTSNFEMSILTKSCIQLLESSDYNVKVRRIFVGSYMTSFDMHGVSLTILNLTGHDELISLLDAPTNAPAWKSCDVWHSNDIVRPSLDQIQEVQVNETSASEYDIASLPPLTITNFATIAKNAILDAVTKLADAEPMLTKYDTIVGDGDCGITMKRGAIEIMSLTQNGSIATSHPIPMFVSLADAVSASMGGTSGILIELMLRKIGSSLRRVKTIGIDELSNVVQSGVDAISLYGGAQVGSRTMLDALVPAAKTLTETKDIVQSSRAAREGANTTASMTQASAGRSNYLSSETLDGTPDPGAVAVAIVFESLADTCG
jgi:triose/dihydroxyacetone kinase / FAD-AMP lyase (cyclizing)